MGDFFIKRVNDQSSSTLIKVPSSPNSTFIFCPFIMNLALYVFLSPSIASSHSTSVAPGYFAVNDDVTPAGTFEVATVSFLASDSVLLLQAGAQVTNSAISAKEMIRFITNILAITYTNQVPIEHPCLTASRRQGARNK